MTEYKEIRVEDIVLTRDNPRQIFDEAKLRELGKSMLEHGQLQEILVRPKEGKYELVTGERRIRAAKLLGISKLRAKIEEIDDAKVMEIRLLENTQREDLTDAEKGNAIAHLLEKYEEKYPTIESLATKLKKSIPTVERWLQKCGRLSEDVKKSIKFNRLSEDAAARLLKFDHETQNKLAQAIIRYDVKSGETGIVYREFIDRYELDAEKYPTIESLEVLANEVMGMKKVKVDLDKLSPKARAEVEKTIEEAKEKASKLRKKRPKKPRSHRRRQGRPRKKKEKPPKPTKHEESEPIPEPTVPKDIQGLMIGTLDVPVKLYENIAGLAEDKGFTISETVLHILKQHFGMS